MRNIRIVTDRAVLSAGNGLSQGHEKQDLHHIQNKTIQKVERWRQLLSIIYRAQL